MRILRIAMLVVMLAILLAGCSGSSNPITSSGPKNGSGAIATAPRQASGFRTIVLTGNGRVVVQQATTDSVSVSVDDNLLPYMTAEVKDGQLLLGQSESFETQAEVRFDVLVKDLAAVELKGSGDIDLMGLAVGQLKIAIPGSGNVTAEGRADLLELSITGAGNYQGEALTSKTGKVDISGTGGALVNATDALDVTIKGSGQVAYLGSPRVTQNVGGSGKVAPYVPEVEEDEE
jgi:hypothetical protein